MDKEEQKLMAESLPDQDPEWIRDGSKNLPEAPMSVSTTLYYRGVSMMITKRDATALIKPLVQSQMALIDWALDEMKCKPSWNDATNKAYESTKTPTVHVEDTKSPAAQIGLTCWSCGAPAEQRTGKKKNGIPWRGLFCSTGNASHTKFL